MHDDDRGLAADRAEFKIQAEDGPEEFDPWYDMRDEFRKGKLGPEYTGPYWDWDAIGERLEQLGWTAAQVQLIKAEAQGITRSRMAEHLGWTAREVERVWRAKNRLLEQPGMLSRIRDALLRENR